MDREMSQKALDRLSGLVLMAAFLLSLTGVCCIAGRTWPKVGYDAPKRIVVLSPADGFRPGMTYVATVEGGSGGAGDIAGNPLPAEKTWSFTVRR